MKNAKTKEIVKFDVETAVIVALDAKYKDLTITDGKSYAVVMQGIAEYRGLRVKIDEKHKELKKDALEYGRAVDGEKNRLKTLLEPGEDYLKHIRLTWDEEKAAIKAEKDRKERERIEAIQEKIQSIRNQGILIHGAPSHIVEERLIIIKAMTISQSVYMECADQAMDAQTTAIRVLEETLTERLQFEKEDAERKAEAERLDTVHKLQEATQVKINEEHRKIAEEKAKIEAEKIEAGNRKRMEDFERQATIQAEQEAKEKGAREEQEKIDKEEAEAKEKARQEALKPDKEKLIKWIQGFNETAIPKPQLKIKEAQEIVRIASEQIEMILQDAMEKAEKL